MDDEPNSVTPARAAAGVAGGSGYVLCTLTCSNC